jgi:hypothetical protein
MPLRWVQSASGSVTCSSMFAQSCTPLPLAIQTSPSSSNNGPASVRPELPQTSTGWAVLPTWATPLAAGPTAVKRSPSSRAWSCQDEFGMVTPANMVLTPLFEQRQTVPAVAVHDADVERSGSDGSPAPELLSQSQKDMTAWPPPST